MQNKLPFQLCDGTNCFHIKSADNKYVGSIDNKEFAEFMLAACNDQPALKQEVSDLKAKNNEIGQALRGAIGAEKYDHIEQLEGRIAIKDKLADVLYGRIGTEKIKNKQLVDLVKKIRVRIIEVGPEKNSALESEILGMINKALN